MNKGVIRKRVVNSAILCLSVIAILSTGYIDREVSENKKGTSSDIIKELCKEDDAYTRIIVQSSNDVSKVANAKDVSRYGDTWILSYNSEDKAEKSKQRLQEKSFIDSVESDAEVICEGDISDVDDSNVEDRINSGSVKVALIDTGVNGVKKEVDLTGEGTGDNNGHGTAMAYQIEDASNGEAEILSIKALKADGRGKLSDVYIGIAYAIEQKVDIINLSLTVKSEVDNGCLREIIKEAENAGIDVIVAAGNEWNDTQGYSPANIQEATVVSSVDINGKISSWSNYGDTIDYSAIGTTKYGSGTSISAAYITGIKASGNFGNGIDLGTPGWDKYYGDATFGIDRSYVTEETTDNNYVRNNISDKHESNEVQAQVLANMNGYYFITINGPRGQSKERIDLTASTNDTSSPWSVSLSQSTVIGNNQYGIRVETWNTFGDWAYYHIGASSNIYMIPFRIYYDCPGYEPTYGEDAVEDYDLGNKYNLMNITCTSFEVNMDTNNVGLTNFGDGGYHHTNMTINLVNHHIVNPSNSTEFGSIGKYAKTGYVGWQPCAGLGYDVMGDFMSGERSYEVGLYGTKIGGHENSPTTNAPARTGYRSVGYCGWNGTNWYQVDMNYAREQQLSYENPCPVYYAGYSYDIEFHANGGKFGNSDSKSVTQPNNLNPLDISSYTPTRTGFNFVGWAYESNATSAYYYSNQIVYDMIPYDASTTRHLYAVWIPKNYLLTINPNGGQYNGSSDVQSNWILTYWSPNYNAIGQAGRTGYRFTGWACNDGASAYDSNGNAVNGSIWYNVNNQMLYIHDDNLQVSAQWQPIEYTITFDGNGNTSGTMENQGMKYDVASNLRQNKFKKEYSIAYNSNGGTWQSISSTTANCSFTGWIWNSNRYNDKQSVKNLTSKDGDSIRMVAQWKNNEIKTSSTKREYKISYDRNTTDECKLGTSEDVVNYNMLGWYTSASGGTKRADNGGKYIPSSSEKLYAHWQPESTKLTSASREGYTFDGWYTDKECTKRAGSAGEDYIPKKDITLYAKWSRNVSITFNLTGGQYNGNQGNVMIKGTIYNDQNYYEFSIDGSKNTAKGLWKEQEGTIKAYGDSYDDNGMNSSYTKTTYTEDGTEIQWRFLGWTDSIVGTVANGSVMSTDTIINRDVPNENCVIQNRGGMETYNLCTYNNNRANKIRVYKDMTLYAVWEPIMSSNSKLARTLGGEVSSNGRASENINNAGSLQFKTAEQGRVDVHVYGSIDSIEINMDADLYKIYKLANEVPELYGKYNDNLNAPLIQDGSHYSSLEENIVYDASKIVNNTSKVFVIPQYIIEYQKYVDGWTQDKTRFNIEVRVIGNSYYWEHYRGHKEQIITNYNVDIGTNGGSNDTEFDQDRIDSDLKWKVKLG